MSKTATIAEFCDDIARTADELRAIADDLRQMFSRSGDTSETDDTSPSPPPEPAPPTSNPTPHEPDITLEVLRAVLTDKSRSGHTAEVRELLQRHGAAKLSDIDPAEYPALLAEAEALQ
jgi:hypothetical protein